MYREIIYVYVAVRSGISYDVTYLSRFEDNSYELNYLVINRAIRYLRQDPEKAIICRRK